MKDLFKDGYVVWKDILNEDFAAKCAEASDELAKQQVNFLDVLPIPYEGIFLELILWEPTWNLLNKYRFEPSFYCTAFINKKPYEPKRPWHQDWWYWLDPISSRQIPCQLAVMYYFRGATKESGCLRVIPGSHRRWHKAHELYGVGDYDDEIAVEVGPTDLVLMDARLLHSTYENKTNNNRLGVNLWHLLKTNEFCPELRGFCARNSPSKDIIPSSKLIPDEGIVSSIKITGESYAPRKDLLSG